MLDLVRIFVVARVICHPFLFLFCVEGLSRLLRSASDLGMLVDYKVPPSVPHISYLFIADDTINFYKVDPQKVSTVHTNLDYYKWALGQMVKPPRVIFVLLRVLPSICD